MFSSFFSKSKIILCGVAVMIFAAADASGQTNEFTYQGRLNDGAIAATGSYDMRFSLFASGGIFPSEVRDRLAVSVANGEFTVILDFSAAQFTGQSRFLAIAIKPAGSPDPYTVLSPRQPFTSSPYAIRSLNAGTARNADQLGGDDASQFPRNSDPRLSDDRNPTAGSANYIQNTGVQQAISNFNISGNGTVAGTLRGDVVQASTGFNIGFQRVLSVPGTNNTFVGVDAGDPASTGTDNSIFGRVAGTQNSTGSFNSVFGSSAGFANTTGARNSFFGRSAGASNISASDNSFFGYFAGEGTTTGFNNAFFGSETGRANTTGEVNAFFGTAAGKANTVGSENSFFGTSAGLSNTGGNQNTFLGRSSGRLNTLGSENTFVGYDAGRGNTTGNLNSFVGTNSGLNNTAGLGNSFFGANSGTTNTTGNNNSFFGRSAGTGNTTGTGNAFFGFVAGQQNSTGNNNSFFGSNAGDSNSIGTSNAFFGKSTGQANGSGSRNSFFGAESGLATTSGFWNIFLGSQSGYSNTIGGYNVFAGGQAGYSNMSGEQNTFIGNTAGRSNISGSDNTFIGQAAGYNATAGTRNTAIGFNAIVASGLTHATAIGAEAEVITSNTIVLGRSSDTVRIKGDLIVDDVQATTGYIETLRVGLNQGGSGNDVCELSAQVGVLTYCSSSLRYKTEVNTFTRGLDVVRRLRPVTFTWKEGGKADVGFVAEEVEQVDPLFATYNEDGLIQGVKYKQITTVLVNAVNEQQEQIAEQKKLIQEQRALIDGLKTLVCSQNPQAAFCREKLK